MSSVRASTTPIYFVDTTVADPQPYINRTVKVLIESSSFHVWRANIIKAVKENFGVVLDTKDIPQFKVRYASHPHVINDDNSVIDDDSITKTSIISVRLPKDKVNQIKEAKQLTVKNPAILFEKKEDLPVVEEYQSPELFKLLENVAFSPNKKQAIWVTKNLICFYDAHEYDAILFDLKENKICKPISDQVKSKESPLRKTVFDYLCRTGFSPEYISDHLVEHNTIKLFVNFNKVISTISPYQFVKISWETINFWDTSNPEQLSLNIIDAPVSFAHANLISGFAALHCSFNTPYWFSAQVFPDKQHLLVKMMQNTYNFMDLNTNEVFTFRQKRRQEDGYHPTAIIINNQQILLNSKDGYHLMTIDFKNKMVKINEKEPTFEINDCDSIIHLSSQVILKITEFKDKNNKFTGYEVSPEGNLTAIPGMTGYFPIHTQLNTGELIYWNKNINEVNIIDPFAQRILPILRLLSSRERVLQLYCNDRDVLILTTEQLFRCTIPNYQQRAEQMLSVVGAKVVENIVMDYMGFNRADQPHLLTKFSFLNIDKAENQAIPFEKKSEPKASSPRPMD